MIVRVNDAGDKEVYINTIQIIQVYQVSESLYNVFLIGDKIVQIDGETLRKIVREG
jgi:hypothetical protein